MRRDSQIALVGLIDKRGVGADRHVVRIAVHAGLDEIHPRRMTLGNEPSRLVCSSRRDSVARCKEPCAIERSLRVLAAHPHALDAIIAKGVDRRHTKAWVDFELLDDLVVDRQRAVAMAEMAVGVNQTRDDGLPCYVDTCCPGGHLQRRRRPNTFDASVADEDRRIRDRRSARAIDDATTNQGDRV